MFDHNFHSTDIRSPFARLHNRDLFSETASTRATEVAQAGQRGEVRQLISHHFGDAVSQQNWETMALRTGDSPADPLTKVRLANPLPETNSKLAEQLRSANDQAQALGVLDYGGAIVSQSHRSDSRSDFEPSDIDAFGLL